MANIDKELQAINEAIYGEQVRKAIHDGIKAVNDSATDSAHVAETKAEIAGEKAEIAETKAGIAGEKAEIAGEKATQAQSYAVGGTGTREDEDTDNAKYYYEQAKSFTPQGYGDLVDKVEELDNDINGSDGVKDSLTKKQDTIPSYTRAEYEAIRDSLPDGTLVNINDDYQEYPTLKVLGTGTFATARTTAIGTAIEGTVTAEFEEVPTAIWFSANNNHAGWFTVGAFNLSRTGFSWRGASTNSGSIQGSFRWTAVKF